MVRTGNDWDEILLSEFEAPYFEDIREFLRSEYRRGARVYPPKDEMLRALKLCSCGDCKAVILGQDPYHGRGQANGLAFSVNEGVQLPPSLVNIFEELKNDTGRASDGSGDLSRWAEQGVLLLNTSLSVREGAALSHRGKGWESFTDAIIEKLAEKDGATVFILWGREARNKKALIERAAEVKGVRDKKLILEGAHPSPLSANKGFFGGRYFSRANAFLLSQGEKAINW